MHTAVKITEDAFWIGANDRRIALFENIYPVPTGVSYNSYLITDEKTVLFDTVDSAVKNIFFENLTHALSGRDLDYIMITHMEPDHCSAIADAMKLYPKAKLIGNTTTFRMVEQFFDVNLEGRTLVVKEGDELPIGKRCLKFFSAPMVHWPEVMVVYDPKDKVLYSADAFGTFGALSGNLFSDEVDFKERFLDEARRYYCNIVGKYGAQTAALLKKAAALDIQLICPLHGPLLRGADIEMLIGKYLLWSSYTPEEDKILIVYGSIYGHTANAAEALAIVLAEKGVRNISMFDVSATHSSYIVAEAFKASKLVFASSTYNGSLFTPMESLIADILGAGISDRKIWLIENGSWAAASGKRMREMLEKGKNMEISDCQLSIKSAAKEAQREELLRMAEEIARK